MNSYPGTQTASANTTFPPEMLLVTPADVCRLLNVSRRALQEMVACGAWPRPIRLTQKTVRWRLRDVEAALAAAEGEQ